MNCRSMESLIALYIEGDLNASDLSRVVAHLDGCAACRYFADDLRESQSMFKTLRAGTVNSADLADVRQRVLNEVGDLDPAPGWVVAMHRLFFAGLRRRNAIAGVLLAALVTGSVWYSETSIVHEVKRDAAVEVARFEAPAVFVLPERTAPSTEVPRIVNRTALPEILVEASVELPAEPSIVAPLSQDSMASQIPMKFVTDDPDVIIYWLPADKGD